MKTAIELAEVAGSFLPDEKGYFLMQEMSATLLQQAEQLSVWLAANGPGGWIDDLRNKCEALETDYDALKADAERYRHLRATTNWVSNGKGQRIDVRNSPELWDAAIDAMKGKS